MDETYIVGPDVDLLDPPSDGPVYVLPVSPLAPDPAQLLPEEHPGEGWELDGIETYGLSPINPSDTSGLKKILLEIIGPYDNIVTQYRYQQSNNQYYTYVNEITPDYPWIASSLLFIVLVVSVFRMFRSVLWKQ